MARRPTHEMPDDVAAALATAKVQRQYDERPHYQQNDYLGWIVQAKRADTRQKRIDQVIKELATGGLYMGMEHPPSAR